MGNSFQGIVRQEQTMVDDQQQKIQKIVTALTQQTQHQQQQSTKCAVNVDGKDLRRESPDMMLQHHHNQMVDH